MFKVLSVVATCLFWCGSTVAAEPYKGKSEPSDGVVVQNIKTLKLVKSGDGIVNSIVRENPTNVRVLGKHEDHSGSYRVFYCFEIGNAKRGCDDDVSLIRLDSNIWIMKHQQGWRVIEQ